MKTFEVIVQFTTNFLGAGKRVNGVRKLERSKIGSILLPVKELKNEVKAPYTWNLKDIGDVRVNILRRIYNRVRVDRFEGIEKGTRVTLELEVDAQADLPRVTQLAEKLGKSGRSQWGRKFNCGKFKVIAITNKNL